MPTAIIDINDAGIRTGINGEIRGESPGYAILDNGQLMVGEQAQANSRLLPRWTNNRFWNQLGTDPLPNGTEMVRHHADLAFSHLEHVWQSIPGGVDQSILAVPGFYARDQLSLLLGMARECGMPVAGLVDSSLIAAAGRPLHPLVLHLDIFLHRITLTTLSAETTLRRKETLTISETGLFTLWDRWANIIASQFIQTSRYDPMHQAASEQRLYDLLPHWVAQLAGSRSGSFDMEVNGARHQVAVSQDQLLAACANIYPQIVQLVKDQIPARTSASLLVSDRFSGFPGFAESLSLIQDADVTYLEADEITRNFHRLENSLLSESRDITHITSLPISPSRPKTATASGQRPPTHVLCGSHAHAIGQALKIGSIEDGEIVTNEADPACTIFARGNEVLIENHAPDRVAFDEAQGALRRGDRITVDGATVTLITVS